MKEVIRIEAVALTLHNDAARLRKVLERCNVPPPPRKGKQWYLKRFYGATPGYWANAIATLSGDRFFARTRARAHVTRI
ncbi:MAG: hypothetical protein EOP56_15025 [Sphingobacteriales bacterium]|nr:MAG: hypothetical protein EOP56_15025 [Sphingobacteriales bacterium]